MEANRPGFEVMGSTADVVVDRSAVDLMPWARGRLRQLEEMWTRFSPTSEVSRINCSAGQWTSVGIETVALLELSRMGWIMTRGLFDPTGLPALLAAGYVSSRLDPNRSTTGVEARSFPSGGCDGFEIEGSSVRLPPGVTVDPGGIGKGLAADLVATELVRRGAIGAMVNVGGDLRVVDQAPADGRGWAVDVEDPFQEGRTVVRLNLSQGGVATSTPRHRRWRSESGSGRHLIDPRTGHPSETDVESVTVVAGEAWIAEVVAKAAALVGTESATALIDDLGLAGIVISDEGRVLTSARFVEFLL